MGSYLHCVIPGRSEQVIEELFIKKEGEVMQAEKRRNHYFMWVMLILGVVVVPLVLSSEGRAENGLVKWERIEGVTVPGNVFTQNNVVAGVNSVGFSWSTTMGKAKVNLINGQVQFWVKGLVLAAQNFPAGGLVIGTPSPAVNAVKGTIVCNASEPPPFGGVVLVDTDSVPLSLQGDAQFEGEVGLPFVCDNIAFLIRVASPSLIFDNWIAYGAVRSP